MRVSFTFEVTGGPGLPSASLLGGRIQRDKLFSIYRFVTLALVMGLSIALIPLSITQREHMYGRWYRSERARLSYVCGLSVTSLLFTLVAVMSDFVSFPTSAPLWVEFGLSWAFSIMWLACAVLAIELRDANLILAFIIFGCVIAYTFALSCKTLRLIARGEHPWARAVHRMEEKGVALGDEEADALLRRASIDSGHTACSSEPTPATPAAV